MYLLLADDGRDISLVSGDAVTAVNGNNNDVASSGTDSSPTVDNVIIGGVNNNRNDTPTSDSELYAAED